MAVEITIIIEDINERMAEGYTHTVLERSTSPNGTYTTVTNILMVTSVYSYTVTDPAGDLNKYYKYRYSNLGSLLSDYTNPFRPEGITRQRLRQYVINTYKAGLVFESNGGTNPIVSTADSRVMSTVFRGNRGLGQWLMPSSGTRAGEIRRISLPDPANGDFTVNPAFSGDVGSGELVEWHWVLDPQTINDICMERAVKRYWFIDRVPFNMDGLSAEVNLATIYPWITHKNQIASLWWYPYGSEIEYAFGGGSTWWNVRQDIDGIHLMLQPVQAASQTIYIEASRQVDALYTEASIVPYGLSLELLAAFVWDEMLAYLIRGGVAQGIETGLWKRERAELAAGELRRLISENLPSPRRGVPPMSEPDYFPTRSKAR